MTAARWVLACRVALVLTLSALTWFAFGTESRTIVKMLGDNVSHVTAFVVLALLVDGAFPQVPFWRAKVPLLLAYGVGLEALQTLFPLRVFSYWDVLADVVGITIYAVLRPLIRLTRVRFSQG